MSRIIEFRKPTSKAARELVHGKACAFTGHRPQSLPFGFDESDKRCTALKSAMCALSCSGGLLSYHHISLTNRNFYK